MIKKTKVKQSRLTTVAASYCVGRPPLLFPPPMSPPHPPSPPDFPIP